MSEEENKEFGPIQKAYACNNCIEKKGVKMLSPTSKLFPNLNFKEKDCKILSDSDIAILEKIAIQEPDFYKLYNEVKYCCFNSRMLRIRDYLDEWKMMNNLEDVIKN
jgi:hypothetical protein